MTVCSRKTRQCACAAIGRSLCADVDSVSLEESAKPRVYFSRSRHSGAHSAACDPVEVIVCPRPSSSIPIPATTKCPSASIWTTLVKSDTLIDSLLILLRTRPELAFKLPGKVLLGKAAFKAYVSASVSLDAAHLPYNRLLLKFLQQERAKGRRIYVATGADSSIAQRVAAHLGLFAGVLGSDGATNLTGTNKLDRMRTLLGSGAFDYIGNHTPDLPLLAAAHEAMVANPSLRLRWGLKRRASIPPASSLNVAIPCGRCSRLRGPTSGPRTCSSSCPCCSPTSPGLRSCSPPCWPFPLFARRLGHLHRQRPA